MSGRGSAVAIMPLHCANADARAGHLLRALRGVSPRPSRVVPAGAGSVLLAAAPAGVRMGRAGRVGGSGGWQAMDER